MRGYTSRLCFLIVAVTAWTLLGGSVVRGAEAGDPAPEVGSGHWLNAPDNTRLADFSGEIVLIDLWGIQCPPCVQSLDRLDRLYRERRGEGLQVLAVHVQQHAALARQYFEGQGYLMPATFDPAVYEGLPRPGTIPHSIVLNAEGRIAFAGDPEEAVRVALAELQRLHEPAPPPETAVVETVSVPPRRPDETLTWHREAAAIPHAD